MKVIFFYLVMLYFLFLCWGTLFAEINPFHRLSHLRDALWKFHQRNGCGLVICIIGVHTATQQEVQKIIKSSHLPSQLFLKSLRNFQGIQTVLTMLPQRLKCFCKVVLTVFGVGGSDDFPVLENILWVLPPPPPPQLKPRMLFRAPKTRVLVGKNRCAPLPHLPKTQETTCIRLSTILREGIDRCHVWFLYSKVNNKKYSLG